MSLVKLWRGIRFADLEHRFSTPTIAGPPDSVRTGGGFGAVPWQPLIEGFDLGGERADDCLFLNIWAPDNAVDLPVLLWFYGGGFETGASSMDAYDGAALAARANCVVVTANYRLGFIGFGYLAHRGGRLSHASNLGVRDALAAWEWTQRHISSFGGDPSQITLSGQSAGGFLSCAAAVAPAGRSPASLALFSGGASRVSSEDTAIELGEALLTRLGCEHDAEAVIDVPAEQILAAQGDIVPRDLGVRNGPSPRALGVAIDISSPEPVVPVHPLDAIASGRLTATSILSSATVDEAAGFPHESVSAASDAAVESELRAFAGDADIAALAHAYSVIGDAEERRKRILTDYIYRLPAARLVRTQFAAGGRAALADIGREGDELAYHGRELRSLFARDGATPASKEALRVFVDLITAGVLPRGSLNRPALAGAENPADVLRPDVLVSLWEGASRA